MSNPRSGQSSSLLRLARKYFVSAFVVFSFTAYAIHERRSEVNGGDPVLPPPVSSETRQATSTSIDTPSAPEPTHENLQPITPQASPTDIPPVLTSAKAQPTAIPPTATLVPTAVPPTAAPTDTPTGQYKDGQYTGNTADAFYGLVQVKAIISNGKITDVQFLQYPRDRRTSQRINQVAVPYLRTEAIHAQNADVDIISGATLTSQAFIESLQSALNSAKS